jgi:hypothetical protein
MWWLDPGKEVLNVVSPGLWWTILYVLTLFYLAIQSHTRPLCDEP